MRLSRAMVVVRALFVRRVLFAPLVLAALGGANGAVGCAAASPESAPPIVPVSESDSTPANDPSALADLDRGERVIAVAGGDCAAACEALSVIVRARVRLCSPTTSSCADAERRETAATKQVGSFCDPCASLGAP